ncbi:MAG: hypothetical protein ACD_17C00301G0001 [uncultured bacterium]|nr:MAG: hypothetical protein ACD_17C00301G0001 [uncultured bacterium]
MQSIPAPRFLPLSLGVYLGALSPMNDMNDKILRVALPLLTFLTYGPHFVPRDTQQGIPAILADFSLGTLVAYYLKVLWKEGSVPRSQPNEPPCFHTVSFSQKVHVSRMKLALSLSILLSSFFKAANPEDTALRPLAGFLANYWLCQVTGSYLAPLAARCHALFTPERFSLLWKSMRGLSHFGFMATFPFALATNATVSAVSSACLGLCDGYSNQALQAEMGGIQLPRVPQFQETDYLDTGRWKIWRAFLALFPPSAATIFTCLKLAASKENDVNQDLSATLGGFLFGYLWMLPDTRWLPSQQAGVLQHIMPNYWITPSLFNPSVLCLAIQHTFTIVGQKALGEEDALRKIVRPVFYTLFGLAIAKDWVGLVSARKRSSIMFPLNSMLLHILRLISHK